jgi:putative membrane protein
VKKITFFILCGLVGTLCVHAQVPQPDPDTTAKHFLQIASIGNLQEVSAGQLAVQKAKRTDVRSFGQMMVKDHGEAEQKLMELVKRKKIDLTQAASGGIQPDLNLKNAGDKFDEMYVHAMLPGHKNTVEIFENYATTGKDPDVKAYAQQTLPILKEHLAMITAIDKKMKSATTTK